jgi:hypothetical protein
MKQTTVIDSLQSSVAMFLISMMVCLLMMIQMCGHGMAYPLFYDLVAEQSQKQRVSDLLTVTLDYIMENNWTLIDITGKRTQWGFFHCFLPIHFGRQLIVPFDNINRFLGSS